MCNRHFSFLKKFLLFSFVFFAAVTEIVSEEVIQPAVEKFVQKAFSQKTETAVRLYFEKNLANLPNKPAQSQALVFLAEYEQHNGSYSQAAGHYRQAAELNPEAKTALLLEAVRALLCGGRFDSAGSLLREIAAALPVSDENPDYRTAAVYDAWRLLAEDRADHAIPLITAYTKRKSFSAYHPALLFTLWWLDGNETAKQQLLKDYPSSMEAAAVKGLVTIQPSTFWYLMPKNSIVQDRSIIDTEMPEGAVTQAPVQSAETGAAKPLYYQLGFYRTKQYAESLAADLQKKNFLPIIKEETRPSGTVYFAVLVKENAVGDMGLRLKDAGYEAFPIFP